MQTQNRYAMQCNILQTFTWKIIIKISTYHLNHGHRLLDAYLQDWKLLGHCHIESKVYQKQGWENH